MSIAILTLVFGVAALAASAFVVLPYLRARKAPENTSANAKGWLALAGGLGVVVVGLSTYAWLGQPQVALATMGTPSNTDYPALVATLARRMPGRPGDLEGWTLLGRGYMALGNPEQGAKALAQAVSIARDRDGEASAALLSDYGEALTEANGQVTDDAETAFKQALMQEPGSLIPRYFLGLARFQRSDKAGALEIWEALLADAPANAPWRGQLVDQVANLKGQAGGAAPNPMAMVAQLASRLESNPNDLEGWLRLIRAYSVLGDKEKAMGALTRAKTVFASQAQAQAALEAAAKENSLN
jgi:cytochrome c-type biogenesis protein CcmH